MSEHGNNTGQAYDSAEGVSGACTPAEQSPAELRKALDFALKKLQIVGSVTRHDVLNQLTAIVGYTELLGMMVEDPKQLSFIDKEKAAIDKIRRQFRFSKEYQNIGVEPPRWQLLKSVIHQAIEEADIRAIRVTNKMGGESVYADPSFEKVLANLFENTLRHGESASEIRVSVARRDPGVVLVVEDNGPGIPQDQKAKVFERGYGKGTGWGLFLAREILLFDGMTIDENGECGKGARFEIVIPHSHFRVEGGELQAPSSR